MWGVKAPVARRLTLPDLDRMVQIANERSFAMVVEPAGARYLPARRGGAHVGPHEIVLYTLNTDARTPT